MNEIFEDLTTREQRMGKKSRTFGENLAILAFAISIGLGFGVIISHLIWGTNFLN